MQSYFDYETLFRGSFTCFNAEHKMLPVNYSLGRYHAEHIITELTTFDGDRFYYDKVSDSYVFKFSAGAEYNVQLSAYYFDTCMTGIIVQYRLTKTVIDKLLALCPYAKP
jgi:hypothetical protein